MKYSIITPVYNRADCIIRCIESVITQLQWDVSFEHVIVDDGSTDGTAKIIQAYEQEYSHIKFIKFPTNRGTNAARNAAIASAEGQFCILLDSDDYFVNDALNIIDSQISNRPEFRHYLFAMDDCVIYYNNNNLLKERQGIVTFKDFLLGEVNGDFVHVVDRLIMNKYPFKEELIIYEGLFFLQFYKMAGSILFTNKIVTLLERNRRDGVSRLSLRTTKKSIYRRITAINQEIEWFENDYIAFGAEEKLIKMKLGLLENYLLLSDYKLAGSIVKDLKARNIPVPYKYLFIFNFRLGTVFRLSVKSYLILKYSVLRHKIS